jgi:Cu(I)/Ag(I) efflux system membrane protein CusA/SilA
MIDRLIALAVRRRWWVIAFAAAWAACGIAAVSWTPIDAVPDLSENQVLVYADWPGHGPEDVDRNVTWPLSQGLAGISGLRAMRGSSDIGTATLYLVFADDVSFPEARRRVLERLVGGSRGLPENVVPRLAPDGIPTGQIYWYTVEGQGFDLAELRTIQDAYVAPQLLSVPGVADVASVGGFVREIQICIDSSSLLQARLSVRDVCDAVAAAKAAVGGHVVQQGNSELVVQVMPQQDPRQDAADPYRLAELEQLLLPAAHGTVRLGTVAHIKLGAANRRGMLEKDGNEVVGGVVHLRYGHNPLAVTRAVQARLRELQPGLPSGIRLVPCYDRTPLILGAVGTVTRTLVEAMLVASISVIIVLRHFRASLVIAVTLPLVVLGAFAGMWLLRTTGIVDVQTNIMSLAGIVISIGVLVDSSIVMTENVVHQLHRRYGTQPVRHIDAELVIRACQSVGRPVFFSVLIMLISFLPVFALSGIDGRMYSPLAWTKTLALVSAAVLAVTLVPALCALMVRGRMRDESESWIVRSVISVYRPILAYLFDRPGPLLWLLSATLVAASAPLGQRWLLLTSLSVGVVVTGMTLQTRRWRTAGVLSLIMLGLLAEQRMKPLGIELRMPLDEGMVMDMPITVPRASISQSADDVKARDMVLCRFPEVQMVVGKAGRAETPFDPAPLDMIETMIEFRPQAWWPRRRLRREDAERHARMVWQGLMDAGLVQPPADGAAQGPLIDEVVEGGLQRYDAIQREVAHLRIQEFLQALRGRLGGRLVREVAGRLAAERHLTRTLAVSDFAAVQNRLPADRLAELAHGPAAEPLEACTQEVITFLRTVALLREPHDASGVSRESDGSSQIAPITISARDSRRILAAVREEYQYQWRRFVPALNDELLRRAATLWTRIVSEELIARTVVRDEALAKVLRQAYQARYATPRPHHRSEEGNGNGTQHLMLGNSSLPIIDPHPGFDSLQSRLAAELTASLELETHRPDTLAGFGGEMDRALQMPGWTNVWTKPIQNRVDMLTTGVNAEVGVRVLGRNLDDVVRASEDVAAVLRTIPGASDVVADPIRGKGYLRILPDPRRAAELGVSLVDVHQVAEISLAGRVVAHEFTARERVPIRVKFDFRDAVDEPSIRRLLVPIRTAPQAAGIRSQEGWTGVTLDRIADIRGAEGPATIKSENGWLRNYVRLNVRDRSVLQFVDQARREVAAKVALPKGTFLEWTGQYEHSLRARHRLLLLMPVVIGLILLILYLTYRDWADALLMVVAIPGALAGGVLCQWMFGFPFSIAVGVGYIACFGMAAATGIVMLVYLRESVERAGPLEQLSLRGLKEAVLAGAVHRLRPKLLTEVTTILGLAPMLWGTGVATEVIRPMAAPVLGGILIADEVIDLLLPVLFYHVRRWRWLNIHRGRVTDVPEPQAADELVETT